MSIASEQAAMGVKQSFDEARALCAFYGEEIARLARTPRLEWTYETFKEIHHAAQRVQELMEQKRYYGAQR